MTANLKALVQKWRDEVAMLPAHSAQRILALAKADELAREIERMESEPVERARTADKGRTHWEGCWREHHACAVAKIDREARTAETPETGAWLPIETAPKVDGEEILGLVKWFSEKPQRRILKWNDGIGKCGYTWPCWMCSVNTIQIPIDKIFGWEPLPEPPQ